MQSPSQHLTPMHQIPKSDKAKNNLGPLAHQNTSNKTKFYLAPIPHQNTSNYINYVTPPNTSRLLSSFLFFYFCKRSDCLSFPFNKRILDESNYRYLKEDDALFNLHIITCANDEFTSTKAIMSISYFTRVILIVECRCSDFDPFVWLHAPRI